MEDAHTALAKSDYPKVLFAADPGSLVSLAFAEQFAASLRNCRLVKLGAGRHFLQEDHPDTIGREVARWISEIAAKG
jgi:haloalkane dehalogenase